MRAHPRNLPPSPCIPILLTSVVMASSRRRPIVLRPLRLGLIVLHSIQQCLMRMTCRYSANPVAALIIATTPARMGADSSGQALTTSSKSGEVSSGGAKLHAEFSGSSAQVAVSPNVGSSRQRTSNPQVGGLNPPGRASHKSRDSSGFPVFYRALLCFARSPSSSAFTAPKCTGRSDSVPFGAK